MSHEYIIRLSEEEEIPSSSYMENIFKDILGYYGPVKYPGATAFEFRSENNKNMKNMPDLYVVCESRDILIANNNGDYLRRVIAALVLNFVNESKGERIEVLRP